MKPLNRSLEEGTIKAILAAERTAALGASQSSDLSDQRIRALDYYVGDMSEDMPAEDGLSDAVSSDVQDTVDGLLPIVLDALTGGERVLEFKATHAGDEAAAKQETDYVDHVINQQNDGFLMWHTAVKDGCLSKNSFVKWWMEKDESRTREDYKGLTEDAYALIADDTTVTIIDSETYQDTDPLTHQPATFYNVTVEAVESKLNPKVGAVPPEEMLISKLARTIQTSPYIGHVRGRPQADVIADHPEHEETIRAAPTRTLTSDNSEGFARQTVQDDEDPLQTSESVNKDMREIEYVEHYLRLALEDDKIARKYKITTVGASYSILDIEEVSSWPFATGTPILMPHRLFGRSVADLVIDIQQINTSLLRATLNNAYFANNQRVEVSETHASENTIDDLLNNRVGGIVRTKMPGGLNQLQTQPIGHWVLPIVQHMDQVREKRTGIGSSNSGVDAEDLQHARTGAVTRIMDSAEMRVKMIARIFAETLAVDLYRGVHEMLQKYSEEKCEFETSGGWITVNPREWKLRKAMKVTLPLGGASKQQMLGFYSSILNIQDTAIKTQGGTDGPLVSLQNVYATVDAMGGLAGIKSIAPFFMKPGPPDPNKPKPPDPRMVEAQAKAQGMQQQTQAAIAGDQAQAQSDAQLEMVKLQAKRQQDQEEFAHKQALDKMKFEHETEMATAKLQHQMALEAFKAEEKIKIDKAQAAASAEKGVGNV